MNQAPWTTFSTTLQRLAIANWGPGSTTRGEVIGFLDDHEAAPSYVHAFESVANTPARLKTTSPALGSYDGFTTDGVVRAEGSGVYVSINDLFTAVGVGCTNYNTSFGTRWIDLRRAGKWTFDIDASYLKAPTVEKTVPSTFHEMEPWKTAEDSSSLPLRLVVLLVAIKNVISTVADFVPFMREIGESTILREDWSTYNMVTPMGAVDGVLEVDIPSTFFDTYRALRAIPVLIEGDTGQYPSSAWYTIAGTPTPVSRIYYFAREMISMVYSLSEYTPQLNSGMPFSASGVTYPQA